MKARARLQITIARLRSQLRRLVARAKRAVRRRLSLMRQANKRRAALDLVKAKWWRRPAFGLAFIAFALVAATKVLPMHPVPEEAPTTIAALPPQEELHSDNTGYIVAVTLDVKNCSAPVYGSATVVVPRGFYAEDPAGKLKRVLFGLAIGDPHVRVTYAEPAEWNVARQHYERNDSWAWHFREGPRRGVVTVARMNHWSTSHEQLDVHFEASWLRPRSYGSCWLAIPELIGPTTKDMSIFAADAVNVDGKVFGAEPLTQGTFSSSATVTTRGPDGRLNSETTGTHYTNEYAGSDTTASLGFVRLVSPLAVLPSEGVGAHPSIGLPSWSCSALHNSPAQESSWLGFSSSAPIFLSSQNADLQEYRTSNESAGCGAWIAISEPDASSGRDEWLLIIGAALSAGVTLLVETAIGRDIRERVRRRRKRTASAS